ncbi:hypothetical protein PMG11_07223 [Penicillium brasilianum]|uniref:Zn(2)-C6 fungal-type domain-containing protein n=1 Tax=Penicillium brasilianum TaxID=104259 RepID=A0A0F7TPD3_PENBI|nr:hypothetical protein PMG11_07223 [Penicillium brasilianum]
MPRALKPPVKAACLACRSSKTRCDGERPCRSCLSRGRECHYQPSRRGGPRRGIRYAELQQHHLSAEDQGAHNPSSPSEIDESFEPLLDNMLGLVTPLAGVHNLDVSPDALSDTSGARQLWGQLTPCADDQFLSASIPEAEPSAVRSYRSEEDIANAYYIYIHPYLPLLPPSIIPQREDQPTLSRPSRETNEAKKTDLPFWPQSSLSLALSALLVLIPPSQGPFSMTEASIVLRRTYAQLFAQAALASVEKEIDEIGPTVHLNAPGACLSQGHSPLHSQVPLQLEPILALVVLAIYEYCQRGNVSRMRGRINQAVTTAMDISLHQLGSTTAEASEAQRRAWWITMFVAYLSSNLHLAPPVVTADDPRITTAYPSLGVHLEPWALLIKAQQTLYASNQMVQRIERITNDTPPPSLGAQIKSLDAVITTLMTKSDQYLRYTFDEDGEGLIAENMWRISRIVIYTARARLHRFRAFMDFPLFLDRYCHLASINTNYPSSTPVPSPTWVTDRNSFFPFTEQESSNVCLKTALVVATAFRNLPYPNPYGTQHRERSPMTSRSMISSVGLIRKSPHTIPYFACCAMQSCYSLLMILHKIRACLATDRLASCYHLLNKPETATEISDAERLIEELRHGVEFLGMSLKSDIMFEGVGGMGREIEHAYLAAFPECSEF